MHKKFALIVLFIVFSTFAETQTRTALYGGLALATGIGHEETNPGLDLRFEAGFKPIPFLSLGGDVDYTWISSEVPSEYDARAGFMFWDIAFDPKFCIPIKEDLDITFGFSPGFCFTRVYAKYEDESYSEVERSFATTEGIALNFHNFTIAFNFKTVFIEEDNHLHWICFNIGHYWSSK